ncbi:MAG: DUF3300 domain-containing protein [Deltaproteobacteria bacterium]|jgi:hypothetical protein|nr:DUF3300 domain-containing protein [Syntrophaceae bacterium]
MKTIKKMIVMIMLIAMLVPAGVWAQDYRDSYAQQTLSQEELAQMLAPIALYPDVLLTQILMAATYPFEVAEAERWITRNPYLRGEALDEALSAKDWDVSVLALCHYPKVLTMLSENLSWTASVGDAFTNQEQDVMDTIQELRARARAAGNLDTSPEQRVVIEDRYIRIEPVAPDYIYIPAYDPYYVYGTWWLPLFPPVPIILPGLVVTGPGVFFSPRFYVGFGVFGWSSFNWIDRQVIIVDIDRTRRYYRWHDRHRDWDRRPWRPDRDRRDIRKKRGDEIPRFRPPAKPVPPGQRWDRPPGDRRPYDPRDRQPRPGDRDKKPDPRKPGVIDRDKRDPGPRPGDIGRKPVVKTPPVPGQDQTPIGPRPGDIGRKPGVKTPPGYDRDIERPPQPGIGPRSQPVIRDRNEPPNRAPGIPQRDPGTIRGRDVPAPPRALPRGEGNGAPPRMMDRGEAPGRGPGPGEGRRP